MTAKKPVVIIGLGCIGGSLARALLAQGVDVRGWSTAAADRERAARSGITVPPEPASLETACAGAMLVVLAVPLGAIASVAHTVLQVVPASTRIVHVGGLQQREALGADEATYARLLGAHPLAGSHETGFGASRPDLFVGCTVSIEERADDRARRALDWLWRTAGARRVDYRPADVHDRLMAWVSHLPQLTATALASTLAGAGIDPDAIGTGARDTTRLAATPLGAWPALLRGAPGELDAALDRLERAIARLRHAIASGDTADLGAVWDRAAEWRRQSGGEPRR